MNSDTQICRQRPGRRGPDHYEDFSPGECRIDQSRIALQRKLHIDRWTRVLVIFNFRFGERRLVLETPVNRPCSFVNPTTLDKPRKHARGFGLVVVRHPQVWIVPLAEDSESFEVARLALQRILCVLTTSATKTLDTEVVLLLAFLLERAFDVYLDGQAMTVVTRNVRRVVAHHRARFDDEVFEDLVHRRAEMNVGVRVWRPIMHDELRATLTCAADQAVKIKLGPLLKPGGFTLREIGLLRKGGLRQIDCLL